MHQINLRTFSRLRYKDPRPVLLDMATIERSIASADVDPRAKRMRTNDLRNVRELRQACLFCYGVSEVTGQKFGAAHCEDEDYDAVATWVRDGTQSFAPTQLKEVRAVGAGYSASRGRRRLGVQRDQARPLPLGGLGKLPRPGRWLAGWRIQLPDGVSGAGYVRFAFRRRTAPTLVAIWPIASLSGFRSFMQVSQRTVG